MDYVSQKHTEMENSVNRKKTIAEQAIARVKASNTILMSVSRRPKGAGVNLEDCILDYDFIDSEGQLVDLSVRCVNKQNRALNYLTRKFTRTPQKGIIYTV